MNDDYRATARAIAAGLRTAAAQSPNEQLAGTGGGSRHRKLPEELRQQFIVFREQLFQRGMYDPVLVRFDTATVPQASTLQIAEELELIAAG